MKGLRNDRRNQSHHRYQPQGLEGEKMNAEEMLAALLAKLSAPAALPVSVDLWDTSNISAYLKRSPDRVRSDIVCLPTFPRPVRLPVKGARALYKAREVIAWAESHTS